MQRSTQDWCGNIANSFDRTVYLFAHGLCPLIRLIKFNYVQQIKRAPLASLSGDEPKNAGTFVIVRNPLVQTEQERPNM